MNEVNLNLAIRLVDELEARGAELCFYLGQNDDIQLQMLCPGVANFQRCRAILKTGLAQGDFGDAFEDELIDRYLAGRMRMFPTLAKGAK